MMSYQSLLAIGSGGFLGAISRAYLNGFISHRFTHDIPVGTLGVNLIGSFIIGILFALFLHTQLFSLHVKSFISTGFLGALTTYSTFAIESFILLQNGHYLHGFANMALNLFGTVTFAGIGFLFTQYFVK